MSSTQPQDPVQAPLPSEASESTKEATSGSRRTKDPYRRAGLEFLTLGAGVTLLFGLMTAPEMRSFCLSIPGVAVILGGMTLAWFAYLLAPWKEGGSKIVSLIFTPIMVPIMLLLSAIGVGTSLCLSFHWGRSKMTYYIFAFARAGVLMVLEGISAGMFVEGMGSASLLESAIRIGLFVLLLVPSVRAMMMVARLGKMPEFYERSNESLLRLFVASLMVLIPAVFSILSWNHVIAPWVALEVSAVLCWLIVDRLDERLKPLIERVARFSKHRDSIYPFDPFVLLGGLLLAVLVGSYWFLPWKVGRVEPVVVEEGRAAPVGEITYWVYSSDRGIPHLRKARKELASLAPPPGKWYTIGYSKEALEALGRRMEALKGDGRRPFSLPRGVHLIVASWEGQDRRQYTSIVWFEVMGVSRITLPLEEGSRLFWTPLENE